MHFLKYIILSALAVSAPTSGIADTYNDTATNCHKAIEIGDRVAFDGYAASILEWRSVFNTQAILSAASCLTAGFNTEWEYHHPTGRFVESATILEEKAATAARDEARKAAADFFQKNGRDLIAAGTLREEENRRQVRTAVYAACSELLTDDHVAALTNILCVESFLQNGLPDN
ncbi:MAG: hypothetical protein Q7J44_13990 [Pseudotabrizicola sp.]|uniref:hypothetical protein n=1 Tax=Pseudotabrizicola sp. TaxID=2939647 RepID=UPI00271703EC|nr:hypothetical protein [Pseudotabrizicola sp.]MDO9639646.1 hypothetical protein [Pseudotabrizicola sp.]